jgi:hypothetical protein
MQGTRQDRELDRPMRIVVLRYQSIRNLVLIEVQVVVTDLLGSVTHL